MSKYARLGQYLARLSVSRWRPTFHEIEAVLGHTLPASARAYPAWWSNGSGMSQSGAWLDIGWQTEELDLGSERVTFRRSEQAMAKNAPRCVEHGPSRQFELHNEPKAIEFRLGMKWRTIGALSLGGDGRLRFPAASQSPGIYRFRLLAASSESSYVGEAVNLARRFAFYRNPGPTQQTNLRLNARLREALLAGAEVSVAVVTDGAWIERSGKREKADLSMKAVRGLFENAALLDGGAAVETLNGSSAA